MATPITSVAGVGAQTAEILVENGFDSAEALAAARQEDLVKINGFGPAKAQKFIAAAQALLGDASNSGKTDESDEQNDGGVEVQEEVQGVEAEKKEETQEDSAEPAEKNPCTQKFCKKKKKSKKVRATAKKKKKASSRNRKSK